MENTANLWHLKARVQSALARNNERFFSDQIDHDTWMYRMNAIVDLYRKVKASKFDCDVTSVPNQSFLRHASENEGVEAPVNPRDLRYNRGAVLEEFGLVSAEKFERDGLCWMRFTITKQGENTLEYLA